MTGFRNDVEHASFSLSAWVDDLQAMGRYSFAKREAVYSGDSDQRAARALGRLVKKGRLVMPRRGFYVLVTLEHRATGAPPASWFIDDFMRYLDQPYYVGLLTAAANYDASHQQPQTFQVVTDRPTRPVEVGRVRVAFFKSGRIRSTPAVPTKTETGFMRVSSPEATVYDIVRFVDSCGGLGNVATVLLELAERLNSEKLVNAADGFETSVVQRTGYLLELVGATELAEHLARRLVSRRTFPVALRPGRSTSKATCNRRWNVLINERVEADL